MGIISEGKIRYNTYQPQISGCIIIERMELSSSIAFRSWSCLMLGMSSEITFFEYPAKYFSGPASFTVFIQRAFFCRQTKLIDSNICKYLPDFKKPEISQIPFKSIYVYLIVESMKIDGPVAYLSKPYTSGYEMVP